MESLQESPVFQQEKRLEVIADHQRIRTTFADLVREVQCLGTGQPESQAQTATAIQYCHSLEAIMIELLRQNHRLEESNRQLQLALDREKGDYDRLLQRFVEQEVTLSGFQRAFPALQEGMRDLRGVWESIGTTDICHTFS